MISPDELDALESAAHGVLGVGCVAIDPDYVAPPGPSPAEAAFLALARLVLRLVSAQRNAEQPAPRLLDVWRENERLRKRVAELEAEAAK